MSISMPEKQLPKQVCQNIKTLRLSRKWTQKEMADRLEISVPAYSKIEAGITDVNFSRLEQIAHIYELSVPLLFDAEPEITMSPMLILKKKLVEREAEITALKDLLIELSVELLGVYNNNRLRRKKNL